MLSTRLILYKSDSKAAQPAHNGPIKYKALDARTRKGRQVAVTQIGKGNFTPDRITPFRLTLKR